MTVLIRYSRYNICSDDSYKDDYKAIKLYIMS